jgi:hypothetical protein
MNSCLHSHDMLIYQFLQARSSAWLERHLDMVEVVGSSPIVPIEIEIL